MTSSPTAPEGDAKAAATDGPPDGELAIALSGGGLRATYFGLGALLFLVDAGLNKRVRAISSVSGGSILSGFVASRCDFREVDPESFDAVAAGLLGCTVRRGLLRSSIVWAYIGLTALAAVVLIGLSFFNFPLVVPRWVLAAAWFCWAAVLLLRGVVLTLQFRRVLFKAGGGATTPADVTSSVEHIFCTTDLPTASPFYFSTWEGGYVYSPVYGIAKDAKVGLDVITRSSAAFPGGIPPKRLPLRRLSFYPVSTLDDFALSRLRHSAWIRWRTKRLQKKRERAERNKYLQPLERMQIRREVERRIGRYELHERTRSFPVAFLADGGIWNNLATDPFLVDRMDRGWAYQGRGKTVGPVGPVELSVISIDSSATDSYASSRLMVVPVVAELLAFTRATKVLYTNTVAPRAATLREQALRQLASGEVPRNLVVSLADWRGDVPDHWLANGPLTDRPPQNDVEDRAQQLQVVWYEDMNASNGVPFRHVVNRPTPTWALGEGESSTPVRRYWYHDRTVPTTLSGLGRVVATRLLVHGYINAMVEAHIAWNVPLVSDLSLDRFERLFSAR